MAEDKKDFKKGDKHDKPKKSGPDFILVLIVIVLVLSALQKTRLGRYLMGTNATSTPGVATTTNY